MLLASLVLLFQGDTGTYPLPLPPELYGSPICASVSVSGRFNMGAEAWGENLDYRLSYYAAQMDTRVGWRVWSGSSLLGAGRIRAQLDLSGGFSASFDGALDFDGASGDSTQCASAGDSQGCGIAGRSIVVEVDDYMELTASWQYFFRPGVVAETHLTIQTAWELGGRVTVR